MNGNYLIPANTKKGSLILGLFKPIDLIIFGVGIAITLILVMLVPIGGIGIALLVISPGLVTGMLVLPVAYYHNVRQLIIEIYKYFTQRNRFEWKGWRFTNESKDNGTK